MTRIPQLGKKYGIETRDLIEMFLMDMSYFDMSVEIEYITNKPITAHVVRTYISMLKQAISEGPLQEFAFAYRCTPKFLQDFIDKDYSPWSVKYEAERLYLSGVKNLTKAIGDIVMPTRETYRENLIRRQKPLNRIYTLSSQIKRNSVGRCD